MKKIFLVVLFISAFGFSQNLNHYKYALVPAKFNFLKEANQHNLNVMTKLFMEKYKFETYLDNEVFPEDFAKDNCNKIFVDVLDNSTMFTTRVTVVIKDCKNTILFTSTEGKSKEKEYKAAYNQALRMAFDSFTILKTHSYQLTQKSLEMIGEPSKIVVVNEIIFNPKSEDNKYTTLTSNVVFGQYFAKPIANGFQIINSESEIIYKIFNTSTKDFFIAIKDNKNGVFFLRNTNWYFEFYEQGKLISEMVSVKF